MEIFLRLWIVLCAALMSSYSMAGGNYASAKIEKLSFDEGHLVLEFRWINESGFMKPTPLTKARFDYQNWQDTRRVSLYRFLPWTKSLHELYPAKSFDECVSWLIEKYKSGENIALGQEGNEDFHATPKGDQFFVPFAELITQNNETACLIYAGTDGRF